MDDRRIATLGVVASLVLMVAVVAPYLLLSSAEAAGLSTYYDFGLVGPWGLVLFGLVTTVAFAAGRQRRSDPATVAGATVAVGLVMTLLAVEWALAVDGSVVASLSTAAWLASHRWLVVGLAVLVPAFGGVYARVLGLI